jgi:Tol biopolymer transport system component
MLPDGEPVQLTRDDLPKMSPVFSPDGARIAYTVNDGDKWDTWEVAALRGEPHRWLRNVSGLTWLGPDDLLYSQVKAGIHMAIVRSNEARTNARDLYVPFHVAGMAHRSYASPDRTRVLVIEMNDRSQWTPCRLLNLDGSGPGQLVGPPNAQCTDAAWSPNGRWMYFTANTSDGFHLWRQRFPNGTPEQLTFGATEEQGIALSADGKSLITSVGVAQRSVWLHDASGERQVSLEGYAYFPLISADEKKIVYRVTRGVGSGQSPSELWVTDIASQRSQRLFPGQLVTSFDLSRDDRVVAAVRGDGGRSTIWLAWLDGREPPQPIPQADGDNPRFGAGADIMFRVAEGATGFVYRMKSDGTNRQRVFEASGTVFGSVSPDGRWLSNLVPRSRSGVSLFSADGQQPVLPSSTISRLRWTLDAKRAYLSIQYAQSSAFADGRTYVLPLARDSVLPRLPAGGFKDEAEIAALPGVERIPYGDVAVASTPGAFAYSRVTTTRNLFRIPLQ